MGDGVQVEGRGWLLPVDAPVRIVDGVVVEGDRGYSRWRRVHAVGIEPKRPRRAVDGTARHGSRDTIVGGAYIHSSGIRRRKPSYTFTPGLPAQLGIPRASLCG